MNSPSFPEPPKWLTWLLRKICSERVLETIEGDLWELYGIRRTKMSRFRSNLIFLYEVLDMIRPFAIKRKWSNNSIHTAMFRNYFKVAWRSLFKHKMYSSIKIGGFGIGMAACILIILFIQDELSYDKNYERKADIYRVINVHAAPEKTDRWASFPPQTGQVLRESFPEIEMAGRLIPFDWFDAGNNQFRRQDRMQNSYEEGFAYADQDLIEILEIPMVYGNRTEALSQPNGILISKSKADKYFPGEDPVGQMIVLNDNTENPYVIGGVMQDFPSNSHLQFDFLISLTAREFWPGEQTNWCCWNYSPYVRVRPGTNKADLEEKLLLIRDGFMVKYAEDQGEADVDNFKYHSFMLQPVSDIYLKSKGIHDPLAHGDYQVVQMFGAIAVLILLLSAINFINLSTAKSANRAKEVGLRKVVGSYRKDLIKQFLTESFIFSFVSMLLGVVLATLALPFFNTLADKTLVIPWGYWWFIPSLVGATLFIGVIAGLYPSFYLSAFRPIQVLKGEKSRGTKSSRLRSVLVVFQIAASVVLIIGALMVHRQMTYILNKDIGFEKERVLLLQGSNTLGERIPAFKGEIAKLAGVSSSSASNYLPVVGTKRDGNAFFKEGRSRLDASVGAQMWRADDEYLETMGMELVEGRMFDLDRASDSSAIIINQEMVKQLGLDNPIGSRIENFQRVWTVVGVIKDFNYDNLREIIRPLALSGTSFGEIISVKIQSQDLQASVTQINQVWDEFMPNQPIRYTFLDESFARMYDDVKRTSNVFTSFSVLAIIVACLGLFGLSAFMAEQRTKEISIRKVLGASFNRILLLLTQNFLIMMAISLALAIPVGQYLMRDWLSEFEYQVTLGWDVFIIAGTIVAIISLITISYESIKAIFVNPVKGLRSE
ncbi:MAG: ABC transporter permease [Cytophagales bacterium]|nr:ABC transporter permease [Cytophagales bacterium]